MDKVQFNIEVVKMRKVVKRVKVLIAHSLTRHITKLRKKKGSEQQILKNKRRAERFVAEIEAMKNLQPDTVTKKAATMKKTLQEVLNNSKSTAQDRVLARIVDHKLIQERVSQFKDMVTKDFLRTGTKKYKRLRRGKFETEAEARLKEEEDYQVTLERMMSADKREDEDEDEYSQKFARKMRTFAKEDLEVNDGNYDDEDDDNSNDDDDEDDDDDDEYSQKFAEKMRTFAGMDQDDDGSGDGSEDDSDDDEDDDNSDEVSQNFLGKMRTWDKTDQDDDNDDDNDDDENLQVFPRKLRTLERIDHDNDTNEDAHALEKMLIRKMMEGRTDSSDDDSLQSEDGGQVTQHSPQKLTKLQLKPFVGEKEKQMDKFAHRISEDAALPEKSHSIGKRKLDSMFLGSLSSMQDDDIAETLQTTTKEPMQRNKAKPPQMQQPKARPAQETTQEPAKKMRNKKVPMVDQPNPVRHTPGEKMIPGINCHPDLPPRHALRDTHGKNSGRKPFPARPHSKQLPGKPLGSQSRHGAKQYPTQGKQPASASVSSQKKPAATESLHPSWEASKKRKEESKIVPFQGKKITFDDD